MQKLLTSCLVGLVVGMTYAQQSTQAPSNSPPPPTPSWLVHDVFDVYGELTGRNVLISAFLPKLDLTLTPELSADTNRAVAFIETAFTKYGIDVVPDGKKFVRLLRMGWRDTPIAAQLSRIQPPRTGAEEIPPGHINWFGADLNQAMVFYSDLTGTTVLRPANLACPIIRFRNQTSLTRAEFIYAIKALLAFNSVAIIDDGYKFTQVVPIEQAPQIQTRAPKPEKGASLIDPGKIPIFTYSSRISLRPPVPPRPPTPPQQLMNIVTRSYTQAVATVLGPPKPPPKPEMDNLIAFYAKLTGAKAVPSKHFGRNPIHFEITKPVTKAELLYAIETTVAQCGFAIAPAGPNSIQVVPVHELHRSVTNTLPVRR